MPSLTTIAAIAPLLLVFLPLLLGRYPGENAILSAARRRNQNPVPAARREDRPIVFAERMTPTPDVSARALV